MFLPLALFASMAGAAEPIPSLNPSYPPSSLEQREIPLPAPAPKPAGPCPRLDLFAALRQGQLSCVREAASHMDVNDQDADGETPLHEAILLRNGAAIRFLVKNGADLNAPDSLNRTPADLAQQLGYRRLVAYFAEVANESARLSDAVEHDDILAASNSLARGAPVAARGPRSDTPLHRAAQSGFTDMEQLLVQHGAPLEARNYLGETPLLCAALRDDSASMELLLDAGANPNAVDQRRETALDLALLRQNPRVMSLLARYHAHRGEPASVEIDFDGVDGDSGEVAATK